jgi:hypothetical protein
LRRPRLSIVEDAEGIHSRVEGNGLPYVRLLAGNARGRRTAKQTRVFVDRYQENRQGAPVVAMGSPELGWPSTPADGDGGVVFAGGTRPFDFGYLVASWGDVYTQSMPSASISDSPVRIPRPNFQSGKKWELRLALAYNLELADQRECLHWARNGYAVRLVIGAEDGAARRFEVHANCDGDASNAQAALDSVQIDRKTARLRPTVALSAKECGRRGSRRRRPPGRGAEASAAPAFRGGCVEPVSR